MSKRGKSTKNFKTIMAPSVKAGTPQSRDLEDAMHRPCPRCGAQEQAFCTDGKRTWFEGVHNARRFEPKVNEGCMDA